MPRFLCGGRNLPSCARAACTPRFSTALISNAFTWLCRSRRHFPANADIWHLRFHWLTERSRILRALNRGTYRFSAMTLVTRADGSQVAVWSAPDALVIKCLSLLLVNVLPVSRLCEHVHGHGGGRTSVLNAHRLAGSGRYRFVCRTDIREYYGHIDQALLYSQLCRRVRDRHIRDLLWQFLHYSVEDGGVFHTPARGIPRGSALSPLLAAFHLTETDRDFEGHRHVIYVRYMDDFLLFARTRWHLRKAVSRLNRHLSASGFEQHPDKTFIGRVEKGFDWMGFWFTDKGCTSVAPRALKNRTMKLRRLYERFRHQPAVRAERMAQYTRYWLRWAATWAVSGPDVAVGPDLALPSNLPIES